MAGDSIGSISLGFWTKTHVFDKGIVTERIRPESGTLEVRFNEVCFGVTPIENEADERVVHHRAPFNRHS